MAELPADDPEFIRYIQALAKHGVTEPEFAVLATAGYYVPLPRDRFIPHAVWEASPLCSDEVNDRSVDDAVESCLSHKWVELTFRGHVEEHRDRLGNCTGKRTSYPDNGIVLTELGEKLLWRIRIEMHGREPL